MIFQREKRCASIGQGIAVIGFQGQCPVEGRKSLLMTLQILQGTAQIVESIGHVRIDLYRFPNKAFRLFKTPLLELYETEQIKRLKIARGSLQDGAVEPRGFGKVARLMLAHRTAEQ